MSKSSSDYLFRLVKSLSKSEKRYFRLYTSRLGGNKQAKFIRLFDRIDKQKVYDEQAILAKEKTLKPLQLANLKAHLYGQLVQCVRMLHRDSVIDVSIREMISDAQVLYNKCLYDQCVRMLDKAKKLAHKSDRSVLLPDILEMEKIVVSQTVAAKNEIRVTRIVEETEAVAGSIKNINSFSNLWLTLNSFYLKTGFIRNRKDLREVQNFFQESLPGYEKNKLSFHEKFYLYYSFAGYYYFIQDFQRGHGFAKKLVSLFDLYPVMKTVKTEMYAKAINHLLVVQYKLSLYHEFTETYKRLDEVERLAGKKISAHLQLTLFKYRSTHGINRRFMTGDFSGGVKMIPSLETGLEQFRHTLDRHSLLIFYYKMACLCFGNEDYKNTVMWLNKIMNAPTADLREDIQTFARLIALIAHFELGHTGLADYYVKSTYRFLLRKGDLGRFQKSMLHFLKQLNKGVSLVSGFKQLKQQLLPLTKSTYEKRAFIYFDIISWLESKIENRPVQEIIQAKAVQKL